jgi:hypothetical protein
MRIADFELKMKLRVLIGIVLLLWGSFAYSDGQKPFSESPTVSGKVFLYTAKKFGVPFLKASIKIGNGVLEQGKPIYQIQADVESLPYLGLLFRMKNRFTSIMDVDTCSPVRYVKEIDQEGLLIERKNYFQTVTFDPILKKVLVEKKGEREKQEISLPPGTCDPLSLFARYYLKEELHPGEEIRMSIYDGVKLRQMVFHSKKEKLMSKRYGEVEAFCLESTTSFAAFGDKEGIIRIWYTADGGKTPISMELELPIGSVKFELEEVKED